MTFQTVDAGTLFIKGKTTVLLKSEKKFNSSSTEPITYQEDFSQTHDYQDTAIQTDDDTNSEMAVKYKEDEVSKEMKDFIQQAGEIILQQLEVSSKSSAFEDYDSVVDQDQDEDISKIFTLKFDTSCIVNSSEGMSSQLQCTGLSWNSTGSIIAVSFGRFDHSGWCDYNAAVCLWNIFSSTFVPDKPFRVLEVSSGVMCVACHPLKPAVLAAGSFNGEIFLWDISKEEHLLASSQIDDYFHREPIMKIAWSYNKEEKDYDIVSINGEGKILIWSLNSKLSHPIKGLTLSPLQKESKIQETHIVGGLALSINPHHKDHFSCIAGTEGGAVYKCTLRPTYQTRKVLNGWDNQALDVLVHLHDSDREKLKLHVQNYATKKKIIEISRQTIYSSKPPISLIYPNGVDLQYDRHCGPVHDIDFSPFHRNIFLSCGADGTVKLFNIHKTKPIISTEVSVNYLYAVAWSKTRPLVFAVGSDDGSIYVYDLQVSTSTPSVILKSPESSTLSPIYTLSFNPKQRNFLASGDANGAVSIWKLNWKLSNIQSSEQGDLEALGNR